jgi:hypothetical protein
MRSAMRIMGGTIGVIHDPFGANGVCPAQSNGATNVPAGGMGDWWIVAKVVPHKAGGQMIHGIRVLCSSGSRSGSTVYNEQATSDCTT